MGSRFENYVGNALRGQRNEYHIRPSCLDKGDLVVFPAIAHDGAVCEAQFFDKCRLPRKLYQARKRRIQRLKKSRNLLDEVDHDDVKIIVSRVPESSCQNCRNCRLAGTVAAPQHRYSANEFPALRRDPSESGCDNPKLPGAKMSFAEVAALHSS
ncbi:hypothetical protein SAMD00023353_0400090 [Rosellinia necatrix]|uniref:Uncharacterized protein n=1 Tax=Rosellinia necatrix TaxID=77044 RepID=A0A1S7UJ46_ROSNE|nr:hypothetical protein SAMD00023353_0400090 [Rosellinia necatrix]